MKEVYFYMEPEGRKVTVCLLVGDENEGLYNGIALARGVAICSKKDNFSKKIGRAIAKGRAWKAACSQHYAPIRRPEIKNLLPVSVSHKGTKNPPMLMDIENRIIESIMGLEKQTA